VPPTPTAIRYSTDKLEIGCSISRQNIRAGEAVTLSALQSPAGPSVRYRFNHGDGTQDPVAVSQAYYATPGTYQVTLDWFFLGSIGTVPCGTVTVSGASAPATTASTTYIGLTRDQAISRAGVNGYRLVRLVREDGVVYRAASDSRGDRLNIEIDNGRVTSAFAG